MESIEKLPHIQYEIRVMDALTLQIDHLNPFALGVAHHNGTKYYVPFVLPGELVRARPRLKRKSGLLCELVEVLEASEDRAPPLCRYYQSCGGCDLQHMSYAVELRFKQAWIGELARLFVRTAIAPIIPSPTHYRYRNRITLHSNGSQIGFYRRGTHDVIAIEDCVTASQKLNEKLQTLSLSAFAEGENFELREDEGRSFRQVNTAMNDVLLKVVKDFSGGRKSQRVLELYSGRGNMTFALAEISREVVAVEGSAEAIAHAEERRRELGVKKVKFVQSDVFQAAYKFKQDYENFDLLVCDPPRGGLGNVATVIPELGAQKIIYVSCDFFTLERDLTLLSQNGYQITRIQPLDMFPRTHHIELVAEAERK